RDVPSRLVRMGRYALAATIDDIILNTDWGGQRAWGSRSLVSLLYNETWGGERFYDLLSQMRLNPEDNIDGLELMAICLAVGFSGKYRVMEGGHGQVSRLRHELYRTIRRVRGPYERDLSPPWEAVAPAHAAPKSARAAWIVATLAGLLVAALWIASSLNLRTRVATAAEEIDALAPKIPVMVQQPVIPNIPEPRTPVVKTQVQRLSGFLADDIAAGTVEVAKVGERVVIRMLKASFPTGGAVLAGSEEPLISRIGAALDGEKGPILVVGHTDNVPVPAGSSLGDNTAISRARAQSTADVLRRHVKDPGRVSSEGRGSDDPIASNDTIEGRSRNRRVDFWIDAEEGH
ncbi:type IVB secretion system protein IcmH/DotU, partial [Mesorhizobium sp.]|uniref:type IVB secretion system protein IcmH/DotU n=1 Tax=Mesorhizobium sp. TaxID=1871066 RepID=UPI0025DAE6C2